MRPDRRLAAAVLLAATAVLEPNASAQSKAPPAADPRPSPPIERTAPAARLAPPIEREATPPPPVRPAGDPLARYRDDRTYRYRENPHSESILQRMWHAFLRTISKWLGRATWDERYWRITVGVLIALAVFFAARLFARYGAGTLFKRVGRNDSTDAEALPERLDTLDLDRWLRDALADGDARRAVRAVYLRTLRDLAERRLIVYRPKTTNADYLRALPPDVADALAPLARRFEELWYGNYPPRPSDADEAQRHEAVVRAAAAGAVLAPEAPAPPPEPMEVTDDA